MNLGGAKKIQFLMIWTWSYNRYFYESPHPKKAQFCKFCPHFAPYFRNFAPIFQFLRCTYVHLVSCGKYLRLGPRNIYFFIISIIWIVFVVTLILYQDSRWAYALDNNIQTLFWKSQEIVSLGNLKESLGNDIFCLTWFHELMMSFFYDNCWIWIKIIL